MKDDLTVRIDISASTPVYRQIVDGIRTHLVDGSLSPGDRLPTVRLLARDLGVHHNTVAEAYRLLANEGWLDLKRGRGAEVRNRQVPRQEPETVARFERQLTELIARFRSEGLEPDQVRALLSHAVEELKEAES